MEDINLEIFDNLANFREYCKNGNVDSAKKIFKEIQSDNIINEVFNLAFYNSRINILEWLLKVKPDIMDSFDAKEELQKACIKQNLELMKFIYNSITPSKN